MSTYWKWRVRAYKKGVPAPRGAVALALEETLHADDFSKDVEVIALRERGDVKIQVTRFVKAAGDDDIEE